MNAQQAKAIAAILKKRFPNLTAEEVLDLVLQIMEVTSGSIAHGGPG